jgi:hypothetical protein
MAMNLIPKLVGRFRPRPLSRPRIVLALAVAVAADGLQIWLQVVQPMPEIIDAVAMVLTTALLGFHWLLLPTFLLELIPLVDIAPTWTGCVMAVIALRRRRPAVTEPTPPAIDISTEIAGEPEANSVQHLNAVKPPADPGRQ